MQVVSELTHSCSPIYESSNKAKQKGLTTRSLSVSLKAIHVIVIIMYQRNQKEALQGLKTLKQGKLS
jgi:hypothetical protein